MHTDYPPTPHPSPSRQHQTCVGHSPSPSPQHLPKPSSPRFSVCCLALPRVRLLSRALRQQSLSMAGYVYPPNTRRGRSGFSHKARLTTLIVILGNNTKAFSLRPREWGASRGSREEDKRMQIGFLLVSKLLFFHNVSGYFRFVYYHLVVECIWFEDV